jgi:hypothetical protein
VRNEIAVELLPHHRVEAQGRVVEDHQLRPMGQGEHQAEPHVLALRQMLDFRRQWQLELAEVFEREVMIPGGIERRHESHDLLNPHPSVHLLVFGEITDAGPHLDRLLLRVLAQHADLAGVAIEQAQQRADGGRLPRGIAPQEGERLAPLDPQRQTREDRRAAERLVHVLHFDGVGGHALSCFSA